MSPRALPRALHRLLCSAPTLAVAVALVLAATPAAGQGTDEATTTERGRVPAGTERSTAVVTAEEATRLFREANALYGESRFREAAEAYRAILDGGFENADVHYNLGNALYRTGSVGRAVVEYERALRLDPGHRDARANLEFLREQLADRQTPAGGGTPAVILDRFYAALPTGLAAALASLFYVLLIVVLIAAVLRSGFGAATRTLAIVLAALLVATTGVMFTKMHRERNIVEAVVVVGETAVRTGPGEDFVLEFKLHEGTKVRLAEEREGWARVKVGGTDLEGWLRRNGLERI